VEIVIGEAHQDAVRIAVEMQAPSVAAHLPMFPGDEPGSRRKRRPGRGRLRFRLPGGRVTGRASESVLNTGDPDGEE